MTALDFTLPFSLGLVSSLHCVQMCGPVVLAYSVPLRRESRNPLLAHAAYNAGRITTYSLLGAVAGSAGGAMGLLGKMAGIAQGAALVAGVCMIVAGVLLSGVLPTQQLVRIGGGGLSGFLSRTAGRLARSPRPGSKLALGLALGFLPCGLLYAALLKALETGSAAAGAVTMFAFGLGTAMALLALGVFSSAITGWLGRWSNALAAASVTVLGIYIVWRGTLQVLPGRSCH